MVRSVNASAVLHLTALMAANVLRKYLLVEILAYRHVVSINRIMVLVAPVLQVL